MRVGLMAALPLAMLAGCSRSDPERELRNTIERMARAIEQHEPGDFLDALADDFTRDSGAFGKQEARRLLAGVLLRNEKIVLSAVVTDLQLSGDRARVTLRVIATGARAGGLIPERGQTWEFDSAWRRVDGRWQVFNAEWREGL
jgi:hypothetical protein